MDLTGTELARLFEVDRRTVTNWLRMDPPCPSEGSGQARRFRMKAVVDWMLDRERARHAKALEIEQEKLTEEEVKQARDRRTIIESKLIEMDLAEREGRLVTVEDVDAVGAEIGDRLRAVLINLPSNYTLHLERAGVAPEKGQAVLEEIAEEMTRSLRGAAEELDDSTD